MDETVHTNVGNVVLTPQSELHRRVAEVINDWDPTVFLAYVPPEQRAFNEEFPFALLHQPEGRPSYIIRKLRPEEVNETLITWLWSNDLANTDVLGTLEAQERAREALRLKEKLERKEEQHALGKAILSSPKSIYKHNGITYK